MSQLDPHAPPSLRRRLASMVYEAMLMFGVLFFSGGLFSILLQQRHALYLRNSMEGWLFLVIGAYFIWFWTHGGQTLPMKTWRIKLVTRDGAAVGVKRALGRYLLAWLWVLPGLVVAWASGARTWMMVLIPAANVLLWALTAFFDPQRQFLHDRIAGTRIVGVPELPKTARRK